MGCTDVTKCITPDIKHPGVGHLLLLDLAPIDVKTNMSRNRLGGTALSTVYSQIGSETADMDDPSAVKSLFNLIQIFVNEELITAGHDRSDGGAIVTVLEMALGGNCGLDVTFPNNDDVMGALFGEELGIDVIYTYIHTYIHTYIYTHAHVIIHTYIHTYIHALLKARLLRSCPKTLSWC